MFTPEFRNRLDATIAFNGLSPEIVSMVVDKFIMQLEAQLEDRNVSIELDKKSRAWLVEKGYDRHFGARPLARVIQENIKTPLADELLFGKLVRGGLVKISAKKDKLIFNIKADTVKKKNPGKGNRGSANSKKDPALVQ